MHKKNVYVHKDLWKHVLAQTTHAHTHALVLKDIRHTHTHAHTHVHMSMVLLEHSQAPCPGSAPFKL